MAVISRGIKLSFKLNEDGESGDFTHLTDLLEVPELGGDTESIEITTLGDTARKYTEGIINYGDNLTFKFLYDKVQFQDLNQRAGTIGGVVWKVTLPDDSTCTFEGNGTVKLDGAGVNGALTYTLNIKPSSAMLWE